MMVISNDQFDEYNLRTAPSSYWLLIYICNFYDQISLLDKRKK